MKNAAFQLLSASTLSALILTTAPIPSVHAQVSPGINGGEISLGGAGQFSNPLDGLLQQLQGYLDQIRQMPQMAMEQVQTYIGGVLEQAQAGLDNVLGDLGIVDPDQMREQLLAETENAIDPRVPSSVQNLGVEAAVAGRTIAQATLGEEGQARIKQELEAIVQTVSDSEAVSTASVGLTEPDQQAAENSVEVADQSAQYAQSASNAAGQGEQLAGQAQSRTSTQDVLKLLSQQTAGNGQIMAQLSAQLGGSANQLGQVSSQLSNNSAQNANAAQLQLQTVQLAANQATSAEEANILLSGATLNLTEINDQMRGERIAKLIEQQAETARLGKANYVNYRLLY